MRFFVAGATGNAGRLVVDQLLDSGVEIRALTNNPARAALPAGVEVVEGYLGRIDTTTRSGTRWGPHPASNGPSCVPASS
ncbi:MAG: NAD(P)H-binding protein [Thermomicrobiales bacterium]